MCIRDRGYLRIIQGGMIFNVLSMVINAAQRGCGNTKIAMRTNLVSNGVNIVLNYLLIGGNLGFPKLGVDVYKRQPPSRPARVWS